MQREYADYELLSDEELIDRLRNGETAIMDYICDKYKNLVRSKAKSMFILGGDSEDLIQEGMIGLVSAIRNYSPDGGASFKTYAELCIKRRLYSAIRASYSKKNVSIDDCLSLESPFFDENQADTLNDLHHAFQRGPEDEIIDRENTNDFGENFLSCLSKL